MPEKLKNSLLSQNSEEVITEGSDYVHKSINKDLHENLEEDNYITRYKREKDIAQKLNQYYYNSAEGGFWGGMNGFYDEGSTIFAKSAWKSKIFKLEEGKLVDTDRNYRDIAKVGNFYMGVTVETTKDRSSGIDIKKDGSEKYTLLNKEGKEERALRGSLAFLDEEKVYIEHFSQENKKHHCLYDGNLKKITDNIPSENSFLFHKEGKFLFVNNNKGDDKRYSIINQGDSRGTDYKTEDDPEVANIYEEYLKNNLSPKKNNQDAGYTISYKENTQSVEKVIDKEGNIIFEADDYKYQIAHQDSTEGIFLLKGIEDNTYIKDILINAKTGVKLEFHDMPSSTYINGKVLKHFINNNDSELYNIDTGEKLGKSSSYRDNEHHIQIIEAENGKSKLVENKTGTIIEQDFDKILKMYDDNTKKHFIVENNGSIVDLHINK